MSTRTTLALFLASSALSGLGSLGCSRSAANADHSVAPSRTGPASANRNVSGTKAGAPVDVALSSVTAGDKLVLSLEIRVEADVPRAVARFGLPDGASVLEGAAAVELGALKADETRTVLLTLALSGLKGAEVFGGVDCYISPKVLLHKAARAITVSASPSP